MRKILLVGRSGCGKTTLTQALRGEKITYKKTQYVNHFDVVIDTPGEYAQTRGLSHALALYSYESDIIGLLLSCNEDYSLYSPNIVSGATREVIGIITKVDLAEGDPDRAEHWLRLAGCSKIFRVSALTGQGVTEIFEYLREPGDKLPWEEGQFHNN